MICFLSDFNGNGLADPEDPDLFLDAYMFAEPAADLNDQIEPEWQAIEGTIKSNDQDVYLTFEDTFALLGNAVDDGDAAAAKDAADTIGTAADDYLADYPG